MAATLARPPFSRDGCLYEEKVDGWRIRWRRLQRMSTIWTDGTGRWATGEGRRGSRQWRARWRSGQPGEVAGGMIIEPLA